MITLRKHSVSCSLTCFCVLAFHTSVFCVVAEWPPWGLVSLLLICSRGILVWLEWDLAQLKLHGCVPAYLLWAEPPTPSHPLLSGLSDFICPLSRSRYFPSESLSVSSLFWGRTLFIISTQMAFFWDTSLTVPDYLCIPCHGYLSYCAFPFLT